MEDFELEFDLSSSDAEMSDGGDPGDFNLPGAGASSDVIDNPGAVEDMGNDGNSGAGVGLGDEPYNEGMY